MAGIIREKINLADITRREVELYAGQTHGAAVFSLLDDSQQRYAVVIVPQDKKERPAYIAVMARIVGDYIVVDEDGTLDKPLVEALMVNGGVPREQIILAYQGETLPVP